MFQSGRYIQDMTFDEAAFMIYGICRERYSKENFAELEDELEFIELKASGNLVEAQKKLNARIMQG